VEHGGRHPTFEQRVQQFCDGGFADPAQGKGGQGDAQLGGGNVSVQVVDEAQQQFGLSVSAFRQGYDT